MARARTTFRCVDCGVAAPQWAGRCGGCDAWNTLVEEDESPAPDYGPGNGPGPWRREALSGPAEAPVPIAEVDLSVSEVRRTGVGELDRVLGGGLVAGSLTLLAGEPGIGKSTLLVQMAAGLCATGATVLYVAAEESAAQVRRRAERLGALRPRLWLVAETDLAHIGAHLDEVRPEVVIVDSVQTISDPGLGSAPGSVAQVRHGAHTLATWSREANVATVVVGHVTKEGGLAGPRVLEHTVDTVLSLEGDRHHDLRTLRVGKHRHGSTAELGLFEMTASGLDGVGDASGLFLADRRREVCGSAVVPVVEGRRALLVEIQALAANGNLGNARRSAQGLEPGRLAMVVAVLSARSGLSADGLDVFALAVGGVKVAETGADLALALALGSALVGRAVPPDVVACAELGLGGELRQPGHLGGRLSEAARLGFRAALVPATTPEGPEGLDLVRAETLTGALDAVGLAP